MFLFNTPSLTNSFNVWVPLYGIVACINGPFNNWHSLDKASFAALLILSFLNVNCASRKSLYASFNWLNVFIGSSAIFISPFYVMIDLIFQKARLLENLSTNFLYILILLLTKEYYFVYRVDLISNQL